MPTTLIGDNLGALAIARNPQFHKRSKHIETKWHWIRNLVERGIVWTESVWDPEQTADALTKALARPKHKRHTMEMGLASIRRGVKRYEGYMDRADNQSPTGHSAQDHTWSLRP